MKRIALGLVATVAMGSAIAQAPNAPAVLVRAHAGRSPLHRRQKQPQIIRNLFQEKHVRYAA